MSAGTDTIELLTDKIEHAMDAAIARRRARAQAKTKREPFSPRAFLVARILCWIFAGACGIVGFVLSGFHWSGVTMPTGVISWLAVGVTLGLILESKIQAAAYRQQVRDEHNETHTGQAELARKLAAAPTAVQRLVQDVLVAAEHQRLRHERAMKDLLDDVANGVRHIEARLQAEPVELMALVSQAVAGAEARMRADLRQHADLVVQQAALAAAQAATSAAIKELAGALRSVLAAPADGRVRGGQDAMDAELRGFLLATLDDTGPPTGREP